MRLAGPCGAGRVRDGGSHCSVLTRAGFVLYFGFYCQYIVFYVAQLRMNTSLFYFIFIYLFIACVCVGGLTLKVPRSLLFSLCLYFHLPLMYTVG